MKKREKKKKTRFAILENVYSLLLFFLAGPLALHFKH
jgi:hypothetical protein